MGYSLEATTKDLQVDQCKRDFSTLSDHRAINSGKAQGCWKEIFPYSLFIRLILNTAAQAGTKLLIPHGAVVGIDNLFEARDNCQNVTITFRKPPGSIDMEKSPKTMKPCCLKVPLGRLRRNFPAMLTQLSPGGLNFV